jgi:hypothetical protein
MYYFFLAELIFLIDGSLIFPLSIFTCANLIKGKLINVLFFLVELIILIDGSLS